MDIGLLYVTLKNLIEFNLQDNLNNIYQMMIWEIYLNKIQNSQCICIDTLRIESVLAKCRI